MLYGVCSFSITILQVLPLSNFVQTQKPLWCFSTKSFSIGSTRSSCHRPIDMLAEDEKAIHWLLSDVLVIIEYLSLFMLLYQYKERKLPLWRYFYYDIIWEKCKYLLNIIKYNRCLLYILIFLIFIVVLFWYIVYEIT